MVVVLSVAVALAVVVVILEHTGTTNAHKITLLGYNNIMNKC